MLGARLSCALRGSGQCLQAYAAAGTPSLHHRCVHTVSLLDFRPQGCPAGARTGTQRRRPSAWCRAEHFSTAPFPTEARVVGSPETTSFLRNLRNGSDIYLVGTAHVSKASADEVRQLIRLVRPDVVLLELDEGRAARLQNGESASMLGFLRSTLPGVLLPNKQWGGNVVKLGVGGMYQALRMLGMEPGGEFKAAIEEAHAVNARVVFGDRPVEDTTSRIASRIGFMDLVKLLMTPGPRTGDDKQQRNSRNGSNGAMEDQIEALKTRKAATAMRDHLRRRSPQLASVLVDERDDYLVEQLRMLTGKVVAVVGLAHLDGIEERWHQLEP